MVTYLLKKSYQLRSFREIEFKDLWDDHGVFTTMWIYGSPPKILFTPSFSLFSDIAFIFLKNLLFQTAQF